MKKKRKKMGFATMSKKKRIEIASKGGKAAQKSGKAHTFNSETASAAGKIGGSRPKWKRPV